MISKNATHAPADSLLGQLQRGRGAGFLGAHQEVPAKVWPLLVQCITHDPRLDSQVENRAEYYASLVIMSRMDLAPLAEHLRNNDDSDQCGWNTPLTIVTLGILARRGYGNATAVLRDYVEWGEWWNWAIDELIETRVLESWIDLDEVVCKRFDSDDRLTQGLAYFNTAEKPWANWCERNDRLRQLVEAGRSSINQTPQKPKWDLSNPNVADLLRWAEQDERQCHKLRKVAAHVVKPSDQEFLISQVSIDKPARAQVALAGLAKLANLSLFSWLRDFWRDNPEMPGILRRPAINIMVALPPAQTLPLAHDWLDHPDWHYQLLALEILQRHATFDDAPRLRNAITSAIADDEGQIYRLCSLLETFKRFPALGRVPELEHTFVEFRYSYGRARAAEAMVVTDKEFFIRTFAEECLWDCEERTRELACDLVDTKSRQAQERLGELSVDIWEDEKVRNASKKRLPT